MRRLITDQNLYNLAAGCFKQGLDEPRTLNEIANRTLKKKDLLSLLKFTKSEKLTNIILNKLEPIALSDAVVICDITKANRGVQLNALYMRMSEWISSCVDLEKLFYVMNMLNYRPPSQRLGHLEVPRDISGEKAARILIAIQKLDLTGTEFSFIQSLSNIVVDECPSTSTVAACIFAISSMINITINQKLGILKRLITLIEPNSLNPIDKRQLMRAAVVLSLDNSELDLVKMTLLSYGSEFGVDELPKSSRSHKNVVRELRSILPGTMDIQTEVLVNPISSYIDILVSQKN
jgi:hypothetical protein